MCKISDKSSDHRSKPNLPAQGDSGKLTAMVLFFSILLVVEISLIGIVTLLFRVVSDRLLAGSIGGTLFISLGCLILVIGCKRSELRRTGTFILGCVHLFAISIPMLATRLLNPQVAFEDLRVLGILAPRFHAVSGAVYIALILATSLDLYFIWQRRRVTR